MQAILLFLTFSALIGLRSHLARQPIPTIALVASCVLLSATVYSTRFG